MPKQPSFSEFYDYSLIIDGNNDDHSSGRANGGEEENHGEKLCASSNIEGSSQANSDLFELSCHSGSYSSQPVCTELYHDISEIHGGLKTSTPHLLCTQKMCNELELSISELQLGASNDSVFGTFQFLLRLSVFCDCDFSIPSLACSVHYYYEFLHFIGDCEWSSGRVSLKRASWLLRIFKMMTFCLSACTWSCFLPINDFIGSLLLNGRPSTNEALGNGQVSVDTFLHQFPNFVNRISVYTLC